MSAGASDVSTRALVRRSAVGAAWWGAVGLLLVAVLASVTGPWVAASALNTAIAGDVAGGPVQVSVATWPPPALWWGRVDLLRVHAVGLRVGTVRTETFDATFQNIRLDPAALYVQRRLVIRALGHAVAEITVRQDALAEALAGIPSLRNVAVVLADGRVRLAATASLFGASLAVVGDGRLALRGGTAVDLLFDRIAVAGVPLPDAVAARVTAAVNPVLDIGALPFGLRLAAVRVTNGEVVLDAAAGAQ